MRESEFIKQNREKWAEFESEMSYGFTRPGQLHDVLTQVTDDLSHAQTFYPSRSVRAYLNGLTQRVYKHIRQHRRTRLKALNFFLFEDMPEVVYRSRHSFYIAFALFALSFVVGYVSAAQDASFSEYMLGDGYIEMTKENIEKQDPMAVYKREKAVDMSFGIILNNILVSLRCFILGIFAGIGSVAIMLYNGIMIGAFIQFFAKYNLLWEANLTIWMHGVFEIAAIVIGTAAGIRMGAGLLFPGTYTRLQAFRLASRQAIKIMVVVVGLLFVAGLIEGFLTRWTSLGNMRLVFIVACLLSLIAYFIFLPYYKYKKGFQSDANDLYIEPDLNEPIQYFEVRNTSEILGDALRFMRLNSLLLLRWSFFLAFIHVTLLYFSHIENANQRLMGDYDAFINYLLMASPEEDSWMRPLIWGVCMALFSSVIIQKMVAQAENIELSAAGKFVVWLLSVPVGVLCASLFDSGWVYIILLVAALSFYVYWHFFLTRTQSLMQSVRGVLYTLKHFFSTHLWVFGLILSVLLFTNFLMSSALLYSYRRFLGWGGYNPNSYAEIDYGNLGMAILNGTALYYTIGLMVSVFSMLAYAAVELEEAPGLSRKLETVGKSRQIKGMARE